MNTLSPTFDEWKRTRDWWKKVTPDAFAPVWEALAAGGMPNPEIAALLDRVVIAMCAEFGD